MLAPSSRENEKEEKCKSKDKEGSIDQERPQLSAHTSFIIRSNKNEENTRPQNHLSNLSVSPLDSEATDRRVDGHAVL